MFASSDSTPHCRTTPLNALGVTSRRFGRRTLVRGMLGVLGGTALAHVGGRIAGAQTLPGTTEGDCSDVEGLQLLIDWMAQREVIPHNELIPPREWKLFSTPNSAPPFYYPADWTATPLWATSLTRTGAIDWQTKRSETAYLAGVRVVSPDEQSLYEYVSGTLAGVALDLPGAAKAAEQGFLGDGETTKPICVYEDTTSFPQNWTRAGTSGERSVVTGGTLYSSESAYLTASVLGYQSFVGPKDDFTELMRTIFIPIVFQFMLGSPSRT